MAEVTIDEFNAYLNDYDDSADIAAMKSGMLDAAQDVVESYLGYTLGGSAEETSYTWVNKNSQSVLLPRPAEVITLKINGEIVNFDKHGYFHLIDKDNLYRDYRGAEVEVTARWRLEPTPEIIKLVIKKIAALMYMETNKRIGVTGVTLTDGMSHQYINYNNYNKHLVCLQRYRPPVRSSMRRE